MASANNTPESSPCAVSKVEGIDDSECPAESSSATVSSNIELVQLIANNSTPCDIDLHTLAEERVTEIQGNSRPSQLESVAEHNGEGKKTDKPCEDTEIKFELEGNVTSSGDKKEDRKPEVIFSSDTNDAVPEVGPEEAGPEEAVIDTVFEEVTLSSDCKEGTKSDKGILNDVGAQDEATSEAKVLSGECKDGIHVETCLKVPGLESNVSVPVVDIDIEKDGKSVCEDDAAIPVLHISTEKDGKSGCTGNDAVPVVDIDIEKDGKSVCEDDAAIPVLHISTEKDGKSGCTGNDAVPVVDIDIEKDGKSVCEDDADISVHISTEKDGKSGCTGNDAVPVVDIDIEKDGKSVCEDDAAIPVHISTEKDGKSGCTGNDAVPIVDIDIEEDDKPGSDDRDPKPKGISSSDEMECKDKNGKLTDDENLLEVQECFPSVEIVQDESTDNAEMCKIPLTFEMQGDENKKDELPVTKSSSISVITLDDADENVNDTQHDGDEVDGDVNSSANNQSKGDTVLGENKSRGKKRQLVRSVERKEFVAHPPSPPATRSRISLPPDTQAAKSGPDWRFSKTTKRSWTEKASQPIEVITLDDSDDSVDNVSKEKAPCLAASRGRGRKKVMKDDEMLEKCEDSDSDDSSCTGVPGPSSGRTPQAKASVRGRGRGRGSTGRGRGRGRQRCEADTHLAAGKYTESIDSDTDVSDVLSDELHTLNSSGVLDGNPMLWRSACYDNDEHDWSDNNYDGDRVEREELFTYQDVRTNARKVMLPTTLWSVQIDKKDRFVVYTRVGREKGIHSNVEKALMFPSSIKPVAFIRGKRVPLQFIHINTVNDIAEILSNLNKVAFCSGTGVKQRPLGRYCFGYMNIPNKGQRCSDCLEERRRLLLSYCRKLKRRLASEPIKKK